LKKTFCFIWLGLAPWGGTCKEVQFGLAQGHLLSHGGYLEAGKRKYVGTKTFQKSSDIDIETLRVLIYKTREIDNT
jgi:hypothetical protein